MLIFFFTKTDGLCNIRDSAMAYEEDKTVNNTFMFKCTYGHYWL